MPQLANGLGLSRLRFSGGGFVGPLDDYTSGLLGVWSVARRLLSSYSGPLIRVRRSSDDAEQDIYASSTGILNTAAVTSFVGANNAFITAIYDQSGLGRNLIQTTASVQRRIVLSGTVDTLGGQPTAKATGNQGYTTAEFSSTSATTWSFFCRASLANALDFDRVLSGSPSAAADFNPGSVIGMMRNGANESVAGWSGSLLASVAISYDAQFVASSIFDGANNTLKVGATTNIAAFTGSIAVERFFVGMQSFSTPVAGAASCFSEGVIYNADKSSDDAAIRTALTP